jgi:hypothetical protein
MATSSDPYVNRILQDYENNRAPLSTAGEQATIELLGLIATRLGGLLIQGRE